MATKGTFVCEVCGEPIEPGSAIVLAQEADGVRLPGFQDSAADGRLGTFHEDHWPERVGEWLERDRGHAKER
jgi:hypothetical protein